MRLEDETTMAMDTTFNWDPRTVVGHAITTEPWTNHSPEEKMLWLRQLNSDSNTNTFVTKLTDLECFMTVIIRGNTVLSKFIFLENFQRFTQGPTFMGPYNWPDQHI